MFCVRFCSKCSTIGCEKVCKNAEEKKKCEERHLELYLKFPTKCHVCGIEYGDAKGAAVCEAQHAKPKETK